MFGNNISNTNATMTILTRQRHDFNKNNIFAQLDINKTFDFQKCFDAAQGIFGVFLIVTT